MKVIILAGGSGIRLGNQSLIIPKPLVKIGDKPIIWHIMKIYSYYGYNDFILCLGEKGEIIKDYFFNYDIINRDFKINLSDHSIQYLNNNNEKKWNISLINTGKNTLKGGRLKRIEKFLDSNINMLTYCDGLANINIEDLLKFHKSHGKILTITGVQSPSQFGEIIEEKGRVLKFREKPEIINKLINGGYMVFNSKLFNYLSPEEDCDLEKGPVEELTELGEVMVYKHYGSWKCMDTEKDRILLNTLWVKNKAFWKLG